MYVVIYVVLFFFKQKTAYEMRISDWSSDVCSSDLHRGRKSLRSQRARCSGSGWAIRQASRGLQAHRWGHRLRRDYCRRVAGFRTSTGGRRRHQDRKSVVSGKRGAGRVDLGGPRTMKKKKQIIYKDTYVTTYN